MKEANTMGVEGLTAKELTKALKAQSAAMQAYYITAEQASRVIFPKMRPRKRKKIVRIK